MRYRSLILAAALLTGCGSDPAPQPTAAKTQPGAKAGGKTNAAKPAPKPAPTKPSPPKIDVAPDAFPGVKEAFDAILAGIKANDRQAVYKAEAWLNLKSDAAVGPLAEIAKNPSEDLERRLTAVRALGRIGGVASAPLLELTRVEQRQLRARALESLGLIKPPAPATLARMIELLPRGQDDEMRRTALEGLARIGSPAKDAVDELLEILNDKQENETIRSLAKKALKDIDPRRGLMGVAEKAEGGK